VEKVIISAVKNVMKLMFQKKSNERLMGRI